MHLFDLAKCTELSLFGLFTLGVVAQEANSIGIIRVNNDILELILNIIFPFLN